MGGKANFNTNSSGSSFQVLCTTRLRSTLVAGSFFFSTSYLLSLLTFFFLTSLILKHILITNQLPSKKCQTCILLDQQLPDPTSEVSTKNQCHLQYYDSHSQGKEKKNLCAPVCCSMTLLIPSGYEIREQMFHCLYTATP